jgi:hypothetical protein
VQLIYNPLEITKGEKIQNAFAKLQGDAAKEKQKASQSARFDLGFHVLGGGWQ